MRRFVRGWLTLKWSKQGAGSVVIKKIAVRVVLVKRYGHGDLSKYKARFAPRYTLESDKSTVA